MDTPHITHLTLFAGKIRDYADHEPSAIAKSTFTTPQFLTTLGFTDDEQYEKRFHGGVDRALCHYPGEHYAYWQQQYPALSSRFITPAFGENISTQGLTEENAFLGDIYQLGEAMIQITQPRSPCYKLNYHLQLPQLSLLMQKSGYCGWLYRVIQEGMVAPDATMQLLSRPGNLSLKRAIDIAFNEPFHEKNTLILLSSPGLSTSWTKTMQNRLLTKAVESFSYRLFKQKP